MDNIDMSKIKSYENELYEVILKLKTLEDCYAFFRDLCTPAEIKAMQERWHVAQLLHAGDLSYRDIYNRTGVSISTIGRVARFLKHEPYGGYRKILSK
ncbi:trpr like protein, yerc/yecd [endosymbiont of Acanthamoeba sp. UWC8]|nr:YerC/YecD family TrpR-related protein [Candidatus Jidaibacter acanthamoeba]AIF81924.1 trpr like protein, yerc/yecd [endosymbiont of Acanthamoeba sp. UWC8]